VFDLTPVEFDAAFRQYAERRLGSVISLTSALPHLLQRSVEELNGAIHRALMDLLAVNALGISAQCRPHPPACLHASCEKRVVPHATGQEHQTGQRYQLRKQLSVRTLGTIRSSIPATIAMGIARRRRLPGMTHAPTLERWRT
jgi:hypothetical protein